MTHFSFLRPVGQRGIACLLPALLLLCLSQGVHAQEPAIDPVEALVEAMNVRHIGPGTMSGRVTSIAVPYNEPHVIFVGTAS